MKKKILLVFGTRPEAIKMIPIIRELENRQFCKIYICVTAQHRQMLDNVLDEFNIKPNFDFNIMKENQSLFDITIAVLEGLNGLIEELSPDIVLVHGDTTTAYAATIACFYKGIRVGHIEAGLRSNDFSSPFPEEFNRRSIALIAKYHFAPTKAAKENLLAEGIEEENVYITGNTSIDMLNSNIKKSFIHPILSWVGGDKLILVTAHRRENFGLPIRNMLSSIYRTVNEYDNVKVVIPTHMNTAISHNEIEHKSIKITPPLNVAEFHNILYRSDIVVTDSGGIQEEAVHLNKNVLVMRKATERQEGIIVGKSKLVGTDKKSIYDGIKFLLDEKSLYSKINNGTNLYGDGQASKKIVDVLENICL